MSNIHDVEYGPNPPGAHYEHTDIDPAIGYKFAAWLAVAMMVSAAIVYGTFTFFNSQENAADRMAQKYPLAVGRTPAPPPPNLQTQPFKDLYLLRQGENETLESYSWIDKEGGITRIPIDRAMDVLLQRGLPARSDGTDGLSMVTQDSSSGRTVVPR